jgi:hypothetical protein
MRWRLVFVTLFALQLTAASSAQDTLLRRDNVIVMKTEQGACGLVLNSVIAGRGDANLVLRYDAGKKRVDFSLSSEVTTSLPAEGSVDLKLVFVTDNSYDSSWGALSFDYFEEEGVWRFTHTFYGAEATRILDKSARSTHVALDHKGDPFTGAKLSNSAVAIAEMRRCAFAEAGLNPKDPFAQ